MAKRREIRNSTAEFLIFQIEGKEQGVEVYYKDKTVWCTQKAMGMLFDCTSDNISVHLQNIYDTDELKKEATTEKISVVRREGNRDVNRTLQFYNLDAVISVGYRVNSIDLLSQLSNVTRTLNAQGRTETYTNVLPRYALLHVVYRLNKQPKKKVQ